jgi:enoyl-[acyl-carrier protein] reductase II
VGTRFLATTEAYAHAEYKQHLLRASAADVVETRIFGPEWPDQPMRVLRNQAVRDAEGGRPPAPGPIGRTRLFGQEYVMPPNSAMLPTPETEGDLERMCLAAGTSVGRIESIRPAAEIVAELARAISATNPR